MPRYRGHGMAMKVSARGQVTIPRRIRDRLGFGPGSSVTFEVGDDGGVTIRNTGSGHASLPQVPGRFARVRGCATAGLSTDQIMALTRGADRCKPG